MNSEDEIFSKHRGKSILLDSNLLLVFLTGAFNPRLLKQYRLKDYNYADFQLLVRILGAFKVLLVTPYILTEVSNLANDFPERIKLGWFQHFAVLLTAFNGPPEITERHLHVQEIASTLEFVKFGITDASLSILTKDALIMTADRRLSGVLRSQNKDVLNFHDLRPMQHLLKLKP